MRSSALLAAVALSLAVPGPTAAQPQSQSAAGAEVADPRAVVAEVRRVIAARYVLPERRPLIDAALAQGLGSGRYDVRDARELAQRINADLAEAGQDGHLNFSYHPDMAARLADPSRGQLGNQSAFERIARDSNHGVTEMRVLPGNIRYVSYDGFYWVGEESRAAIEQAMRFLAGGEAAIIDIRRNGGGSPNAVQYMISHFLPPNRPLVEFHMGGQPEPDRRSTLADLPAGRMIDKPLYVLTSNGSASAAEEFAGHVRGFRLGELVGSTTAGAAFRNELVPIAGGFVLSVSVGRPVLAATGGDWERTGIAPTIDVPVEAALDTAHAHALRRLLATKQGPERAALDAVAEGIEARSRPGTPAAPIAAYAGSYGERTVWVEDGKLWYRLARRPQRQLVPLGGHRFTFGDDPSQRLVFHASGDRVTAFDLGPATGPIQGRYERNQ